MIDIQMRQIILKVLFRFPFSPNESYKIIQEIKESITKNYYKQLSIGSVAYLFFIATVIEIVYSIIK